MLAAAALLRSLPDAWLAAQDEQEVNRYKGRPLLPDDLQERPAKEVPDGHDPTHLPFLWRIHEVAAAHR
jgi:hypothetical protein